MSEAMHKNITITIAVDGETVHECEVGVDVGGDNGSRSRTPRDFQVCQEVVVEGDLESGKGTVRKVSDDSISVLINSRKIKFDRDDLRDGKVQPA